MADSPKHSIGIRVHDDWGIQFASRPLGDFSQAILDAQSALGDTLKFKAPPTAETKGGIAALADEAFRRVTGKAHVNFYSR